MPLYRQPRRQTTAGTVLLSIAIWSLPCAASADTMSAAVSGSRTHLKIYLNSHSLVDLQDAATSMQSALSLNQITAQNFIQERRTFVQGWANVLHSVENAYDPTFDPNLHMHCPVPAGGALQPCADPKYISDVGARAAYMAELNAYSQFLNKRQLYIRLEIIDRGAMNYLEGGLDLLRKVAPDGTPSDFTALDAILQNAGLSTARRDAIDATFYARPGT